MSSGRVICSACLRDLDQGGSRDVENGWRHRADQTPRCTGASAHYPRPPEGHQCEMIDERTGQQCNRRAIKYSDRWECGESHEVEVRAETPFRGPGGRRWGAGNARNSPCPCGSGKKWKRCCA